MSNRDYYCSNKFDYLKVDVESQTTYNCHAARPHRIDFSWLESNTGQLFNTPINVSERKMMLINQRNSSCEQNCWKAEDQGLPSSRLISQGHIRKSEQVITQPRVLDITINSDCNLTCTYCCKEFSTSWRNDILNNGSYEIESEPDRYRLHELDYKLASASQAERFNFETTGKILNEISVMATTAEKIIVSGGEPFLSKYLIDIVKSNAHVPTIKIFTGLGVNFKRFERLIDLISEQGNVTLSLSADSTNAGFEFNRYGMKWDDFLKKIDFLEKKNVKFEFSSAISNLTVWGFAELYRMFPSKNFRIDCVYNPNFLSSYILDQETKQQTVEQIQNLNFDQKHVIIDSLKSEPTLQQQADLAKFLKEFVRRRPDLNLSSFPKTFKHWIENVV